MTTTNPISQNLEKIGVYKKERKGAYLLYFWFSETMSTSWRIAWLAFKSEEPIITYAKSKTSELDKDTFVHNWT
jgi:hypothetical protein